MNQNKHILITTLCLPFLFFSSSSFAMLTPFIKKNIKWHEEKRKREEELKEIKNIKTVSAMDTKIDTIKYDIYKECLTELAYITNQPFDQLRHNVDKERALIRKALQKENHRIVRHDKNIPSSMYENFTNIMLEEKINPNNIDLEYITSSNDSNLLASSRGGLYSTFCIKPTIELYSALSKQPKNSQKFIYYHELQHLFLGHTFIKLMTTPHSPQTKKLTSIKEREADIHAASKNIHIARAGIHRRCIHQHPEIIDPQSHCYQMQIMYALMQQKEKLS